MKISEIDSEVKMTDFENFFDVFQDEKGLYKFNLNMSIYLKDAPTKTFLVKHDSFWNTISYNIYGTTRLWWILMKINEVDARHMFDVVPAGSSIKYVDKDIARSIVMSIKGE